MVVNLPVYGRRSNELPTVDEALNFPSLRRGDPVVIAGANGTTRHVRWVHVSEVLGIADLMRGGEMLLTTGVLLPHDAESLRSYIDRLADADVAALVIGLGPRYQEPLPPAMLEAANRRGLPLIALRRTIAFIDVTEEMHASLVDLQVRELQASENIHLIFSSLALQGSRPQIVLKQVAKLSGFAVVLENRSHQVLAFDPADRTRGDVLAEWSEHSSRPARQARTFYDPQTGWLQTTVGARGNNWGRLILMAGAAGARDVDGELDPTMTIPRTLIMLIEQAASTLAIGRLVDRESELLELNTHQSVLNRLLAGRTEPAELDLQAVALGVSLRRQFNLALAIRDSGGDLMQTAPREHALRALSAAVSEFARRLDLPALVAPVDEFTVGVVMPIVATNSSTREASLRVAERLVSALAQSGSQVLVARADLARGVDAVRAHLEECIETVATASSMGMPPGVVTSEELGVRGLLYSLRDDPRLGKFAERTLLPLTEYDARHGSDLLSLLRHYLQAGRNKTAASQRAFVSRPWMHERLRLVGSVLGMDLDSEDDCVTLQVALLIAETVSERDSRVQTSRKAQ